MADYFNVPNTATYNCINIMDFLLMIFLYISYLQLKVLLLVILHYLVQQEYHHYRGC